MAITADERQLLAAAALLPQYAPGGIASFYAAAAVTKQFHICEYILENYATTEHFDEEDVAKLRDALVEIKIGYCQGNA